jgi:hypothetical protein
MVAIPEIIAKVPLHMDTIAEQKMEFNFKIYQCPDKSWRILSEDYIEEWGDCKLRNLTADEVVFEIKKLLQ